LLIFHSHSSSVSLPYLSTRTMSSAPRQLSLFGMGWATNSPKVPVPPEMKDKLIAAIEEMKQSFPTQGIRARSFFFNEGTRAEEMNMIKELTAEKYDLVLIGNGVRSPPPMMPFFERLINLLHENIPKETKIIFNTWPTDSIQGVERWYQRHDVNGQILWTPRPENTM